MRGRVEFPVSVMSDVGFSRERYRIPAGVRKAGGGGLLTGVQRSVQRCPHGEQHRRESEGHVGLLGIRHVQIGERPGEHQ